MYKIILSVFLLVIFVSASEAKDFRITANGKPLVEVVIDDTNVEAMKTTVTELKRWIKEISGASLKVSKVGGETNSPIIRLSFLPDTLDLFPKDREKLKNNDGYAVRLKDNVLYIIGTSPKGVMNGVFRSLTANTGIIWARPAKGGTFFKKNPDIVFTKTDYIEIPAFSWRGWMITGPIDNTIVEGCEWIVRNGGNWLNQSGGGGNRVTEKYGMISQAGGGHNLNTTYISEKKYYDSNPDFFPLIKGKRMRPSEKILRSQICFANKKMQAAFIVELDRLIERNPGIRTFCINIEDNFDCCECPKCTAPIKLADGTTLKVGDKRFYSTLYYLFLNKIARHVKSKVKGGQINSLAYFFTEMPPAIRIEDNIIIVFAPIQRNMKFPLNHPENKVNNKYLEGWLKQTRNVVLRDYYGLQVEFPRPVDVIAVADFRYMYKFGANQHYSEISFDGPPTSDRGLAGRNGTLIWDYSAPFFYVINEAMWHPELDAHEVRNNFIRKVYGDAAPEMIEFYRLIEQEWNNVKGVSLYNDDPHCLWIRYVVNRNISDKLLQLLDKALAKKLDPRIEKTLKDIQDNIKSETAVCAISYKAIKVKGKVVFDEDFQSGEWLNAMPTDDFYLIRTKNPADLNTTVKIICDDKNLYLGVKCSDVPGKTFVSAPAGTSRDKWISNTDKFELFVSGKDSKIYQFIIDPDGNIYDSCNGDAKWNGKFKMQQKKQNGKWSLMLTIPFSELGYSTMPQDASNLMMLRYCYSEKGRGKIFAWKRGFPNVPETYGKLFIK
jgi:uncharacterized protein DUF4838